MLGITIVFGLLIDPTAPSAAQDYEPIDADTLIDLCFEKYDEGLSSGVTAEMKSAAYDTAACLETVIDSLTEGFFYPDSFDQKEVMPKIDQIKAAYLSLMGAIYNQNRGCAPWCGTLNLEPIAAYTGVLGSIIRDIVWVRNAHEF